MQGSSPDFFDAHNFEPKVDRVHTGRLPFQHFRATTADIRLTRPSHNNLQFIFIVTDTEYMVHTGCKPLLQCQVDSVLCPLWVIKMSTVTITNHNSGGWTQAGSQLKSAGLV